MDRKPPETILIGLASSATATNTHLVAGAPVGLLGIQLKTRR
jgi:hypothetical protein